MIFCNTLTLFVLLIQRLRVRVRDELDLEVEDFCLLLLTDLERRAGDETAGVLERRG